MEDLKFTDYEMYLIKDAVLYYSALHPADESYISICKRLVSYCDKL